MSAINKQVKFKVDGKEYSVVTPSGEMERDSKLYFNKAFKQALHSGAMLRIALDGYLREQNIWNDNKQKEFEKLQKKLYDSLVVIEKGGVSASKARMAAINANDARKELIDLLREKNQLDERTAEAQAEEERVNYLISCCVKDEETGERLFSSYDDYIKKSDEPLSRMAAIKFISLYNNIDENFDKNLPEIKFLMDYGYLVEDKDNKEFRYTDRKGNFVDRDGNLLPESVKTEEGQEYEFKPFLDDDGSEIVLNTDDETEEDEESDDD